jgi:hypothetical protein
MTSPDQVGPSLQVASVAEEVPASTAATPVEDVSTADRTVELSTSELQVVAAAADTAAPDEIGPTVVGIPIRNELAAARIAHALGNAREAQALIDEAVELLATVRGLHAETYQLGAARGAIRETTDLLARRIDGSSDDGVAGPTQPFDLKKDPTYEEIAIWMSFGIPVTS